MTPTGKAPIPPRSVRPVGTWVVAGFLVGTMVIMWIVVAVIFHARS